MFGTCTVQAVWVFSVPQNKPTGLTVCTQAIPIAYIRLKKSKILKPPISAGCHVCTRTENVSGIYWSAANALSPETLDIPSKCPCCHVLLRKNYQNENLQNPWITGWIRLERTSEPSGSSSLLQQGHARGHCTEVHTVSSWIIMGKSRTLLALIHFLKSTPSTDISPALQLLAVISLNAI